jgi:uncharacterized protein (TIGR03437 family)
MKSRNIRFRHRFACHARCGVLTQAVAWAFASALCYAQSAQSIVVTSAASFQRGLPPKGSLATAFCTGLQVQGVVNVTTNPLPFTLDGISVTVGGAPAPLLAVADDSGYQQINFEVPQEAAPSSDGTWTVTASQNGTQLTAQIANLQSPGDFFWVGSNLAAFQHAVDYTLVTEQNPAHPGEVLLGYLTGLPGTYPIVPTGEASPFSPLAVVPQGNAPTDVIQFGLLLDGAVIANPCAVNWGVCQTSSLLWLGLTPGTVGVYQLNFVVPPTAAPGDVAIQLQRSSCAVLFGGYCQSGGELLANASPGCVPAGVGRNVCTGSAVPLPIR